MVPSSSEPQLPHPQEDIVPRWKEVQGTLSTVKQCPQRWLSDSRPRLAPHPPIPSASLPLVKVSGSSRARHPLALGQRALGLKPSSPLGRLALLLGFRAHGDNDRDRAVHGAAPTCEACRAMRRMQKDAFRPGEHRGAEQRAEGYGSGAVQSSSPGVPVAPKWHFLKTQGSLLQS